MRGVALFCSSNWKHDAFLCSFFEEGLKEVVPTPPPIKAHGGSPLLMAGVLSLLISVTFFFLHGMPLVEHQLSRMGLDFFEL